MKKTKIQKEIKKIVSSIYFDICLKELINSKEIELEEMQEELNKLKTMDENTYFNNLSIEKKQKLVGFNDDEETQADEKIFIKIDKKMDSQKMKVKKNRREH